MFKIDFEEIDSTNKYLKDNYFKYNDFTFVSAKNQTKGKGREDRKWISNKNENLLFSILIKDETAIKNYQYLSILTAYSVIKVLEELGINNLMIKWPNDIYINDKKVCGILLEGSVPNYIVVGVGLNVNQTVFAGDFRVNPTSLKKETNRQFNIEELKLKIYQQIEIEFTKIIHNDCSFMNDISKYDYLKNKDCSLTMYKHDKNVHVKGIQLDASLLIVDEDKKVTISSGEAILIK